MTLCYLSTFVFQCVVQSYLQWLQDSDYNPCCEFCQRDLGDDQCVRLMCYRELMLKVSVSYLIINNIKMKILIISVNTPCL